jgi:hypothetical protein
MHDFRLLFTAYPRDLDESPLGPSRFDPGAQYWQALIAADGELAIGAILIALIVFLDYDSRPPNCQLCTSMSA